MLMVTLQLDAPRFYLHRKRVFTAKEHTAAEADLLSLFRNASPSPSLALSCFL